MTQPRCPHCQTVLPERATFCAACGNRMEGWSQVPVAPAPSVLPGGEEPTTNMQPTPSLLRVAALSKQPQKTSPKERASQKKEAPESVQTDAVRPQPYARWALLGVVALTAAGLAFVVASRPREVAPPMVARPTVVALPPSPAPISAVTVPEAPPKKKAHRIEPLQVAARPMKHDRGGGLPHKSVATDSRPLETKPPAATKVAIESGTEEAAPLTDEEMKKQAEASIDADGVRFVVKSHLSQVHACYERSFKDASPGGRVEIGFAIGSDGNPKRVRTESNSTGSDVLGTCLEGRVKSWQFPRPIGGDYELIYPFVFAAGS